MPSRSRPITHHIIKTMKSKLATPKSKPATGGSPKPLKPLKPTTRAADKKKASSVHQKAAAGPSKSKSSSSSAANNNNNKRAERGVPFDEMRRLMKVYGSVKCLRKRASKSDADGGESNAKVKIDSVKRKFYRWFPDLEARFAKDAEGFYRPKVGHEEEMRYREERRKEDGEVLAQKRAKCRKQRYGSSGGSSSSKAAARAKAMEGRVTMCPPVVHEMNISMSSGGARPVSPREGKSKATGKKKKKKTIKQESEQEGTNKAAADSTSHSDPITLEFDQNPIIMASADATMTDDTEPLDQSFIAEEGIFDAVEKNFFGPVLAGPLVEDNNCPSIAWSSCSDTTSSSDAEQQQVENKRAAAVRCVSYGEEDDNNNSDGINNNISINSNSNSNTTDNESSSSQTLQEMLDGEFGECCEEILGSDCDGNDSVSGFLFDMISNSETEEV